MNDVAEVCMTLNQDPPKDSCRPIDLIKVDVYDAFPFLMVCFFTFGRKRNFFGRTSRRSETFRSEVARDY